MGKNHYYFGEGNLFNHMFASKTGIENDLVRPVYIQLDVFPENFLIFEFSLMF